MAEPRQPFSTREETYAAFADHLNRGKVKAYDALGLHLVVGEREGARFRDAYTGEWFYNCHCNGGVFNLGHRNPRVVDAVRRNLDALDIGNHHLVSGYRARLAEKLAATTDGRLQGVVLTASGSESNDVAIKLARSREGRRKVVAVRGSYHGHTGLAVAAGDEEYSAPFGAGLPDFVRVPFDDIDALAREVDGTTACVIVEPIVAALGMLPPSPGYLAAVEQVCRDNGALLVADEVQTGLGRTGTFWYHQQEDISPDIVTTGKGLSGGVYPMSAALMTAEVLASFDDKPFVHFSSFGGSELGCAVAEEVVDITADPAFLARVRELGERFAAGFEGLPFELRRRGLAMAFVLGAPGDGLAAVEKLLDHGVFTWLGGVDADSVLFLPPLVLTDDEADDVVRRVREALG